MKIVGYPTIFLFPAADKQNPIEYDGERTAEAIIAFVQDFRSGGQFWSTSDFSGISASDEINEHLETLDASDVGRSELLAENEELSESTENNEEKIEL